MAITPRIHELHQIIEPHLNGGKLLSYSSRYLTKTGDNYGSIMLGLEVRVQQSNGHIENVELVAKLPPFTNELFWNIFQPDRTCRTEIALYKYLQPALQSMQLEMGISRQQLFAGFPAYYGSRISLQPAADKVDKDAVLLLENLQRAGFHAGNRHQMFNLIETKLIIREMARFHALPLALRLKKPQIFDQNIKPYFQPFHVNNILTEDDIQKLDADLFASVRLATNGDSARMQRIREMLEQFHNYTRNMQISDGLYTTIVHCDIWINNLMLKYDSNNGQPIAVKFIDFQLSQYHNLVHDVLFFLFSSVLTKVLNEHLDDLLHLYFKSFTDCLASVSLQTDDYNYIGFLKEIHNNAAIEIIHALFITKYILADDSTIPVDYKDITVTTLSCNAKTTAVIQRTADILRLAQKYNFM